MQYLIRTSAITSNYSRSDLVITEIYCNQIVKSVNIKVNFCDAF